MAMIMPSASNATSSPALTPWTQPYNSPLHPMSNILPTPNSCSLCTFILDSLLSFLPISLWSQTTHSISPHPFLLCAFKAWYLTKSSVLKYHSQIVVFALFLEEHSMSKGWEPSTPQLLPGRESACMSASVHRVSVESIMVLFWAQRVQHKLFPFS